MVLLPSKFLVAELLSLANLFTISFSVVYASNLTYIVDSNVGRSGSAIALNSFFRCTLAFAFEEVAVPMQVSEYEHDSCASSLVLL